MKSRIKQIKYEGNNTDLFYKITFDSKCEPTEITVDDTQAMILIKDGKTDSCLSSGKYEIFNVKKAALGAIKRIGNEVVDVIFMSKTAKLKVLWGTPSLISIEYLNTGIYTKMGLSGEMEIRILTPLQFYRELIGANREADTEWIADRLRSRLLDLIEPTVTKIIRVNEIPFTQLTEHKSEISDAIKNDMKKMLADEYGIELTWFSIRNIYLPEEEKIITKLETIEKEKKEKELSIERENKEKQQAAERERLDDKTYARQVADREMTSRNLATYVALLKSLGIRPTINNIPIVNVQTDPGVAIIKKNTPDVIPQNTQKYCPLCGNSIPTSVKFCPYCGKAIVSAPSTGKTKQVELQAALSDPEMIACTQAAMQDPAIMQQVQAQLADPAFAEQIGAIIKNNPGIAKFCK